MDLSKRRKIKLLQPDKNTLAPSRVLANDGVNSLNINDTRFPQIVKYYFQMQDQFWRPESTKMGRDNLDFKSASPMIQEAYKYGLGNLTAIDTIQMRMARIIAMTIMDPAISLAYSAADNQEGIHTQSYSYAILDKLSITEQNEMLKKAVSDPKARERNSLVVEVLEEMEDATRLFYFGELTEKEFSRYLARGLVAMSVLEGVNFYSTFMMFYYIQYRYKILEGTVSLIRYIHKDEFVHTYLNGHTHRAILTDYPMTAEEEQAHIEWATEFIKENVKREIAYGVDLFSKIKVRPSEIETYIHWLGNVRAQSLGLPIIFPDYPHKAAENPIPWMKAFDDNRLAAGDKQDFFEVTTTQYSQSKSSGTEVSQDELSQLDFD
jgi:ribonucleoside-diphosphate reductase beta chain